MADTTKIYENIFIKKNAAGDREYIKVPYAILADPPTIPSAVTSINGLGGGTLTSPLKITGGDGSGAAKISLNQAANGQITDSSTSTLFGFMSSNTLTVGGNSYALALRGNGTRPTYKGAELALKSDIPSVPTDYVPNTRKVNNKALSSDITLSASDVGALPIAGGTVTGNLTVGGNLTINGTTTTVGSTTLQVKDKLIEVAHGNTASLTTPAGLVAPKYDGTNSGALVFDSTGTAYVGDVTLKDGNIDVANSGLQPLATRTGLVGGNLVQYDSSAQTLKDSGKKISDLALKTDIPTIPTDYVKYTAQTLTDAQKSQARSNIGAGTSSFSGNYNDLSNTPTIPAAVTESTVSGWGFTKNKGTVTSVAVKMNDTTKGTVTSSGTIDLGTVLTSHQDISGKANLSGNNEFVDGVNTFKEIGGTTQISGSSVWLQAVGVQGSASLVVETGNKNEVFKVEADSDNGIIYINRAISIEGDTGTSGQVLTSQGSGNAPAWTTLPKFSLSGTTLTITL